MFCGITLPVNDHWQVTFVVLSCRCLEYTVLEIGSQPRTTFHFQVMTEASLGKPLGRGKDPHCCGERAIIEAIKERTRISMKV